MHGLLLFLLAGNAEAAPLRLQLQNGDIVTGQLLRQNQHSLTLQTSYAGVITIAKSAITATINDSNANTSAVAAPPSAPDAVAATSPTAAAKTADWSLSLDLAASSRSGKERSQSYTLSQQAEYKLASWRYKFDSQYDYETKETARKTHKYLLSPGLDYFYADDLFWRFAVDYQYNYLASDYKNLDISSGPGYSVWRTEFSQLDISVLGGSKKAYFRNEDELKNVLLFGESVNFSFISAEWDYRHRLVLSPLELYSNGNYMKLLSQPIAFIHFDREYKAELGLRYLLSEHLRVSWAWQYDRTDISLRLTGIPELPLTVRDLRHKLSIGASF